MFRSSIIKDPNMLRSLDFADFYKEMKKQRRTIFICGMLATICIQLALGMIYKLYGMIQLGAEISKQLNL